MKVLEMNKAVRIIKAAWKGVDKVRQQASAAYLSEDHVEID